MSATQITNANFDCVPCKFSWRKSETPSHQCCLLCCLQVLVNTVWSLKPPMPVFTVLCLQVFKKDVWNRRSPIRILHCQYVFMKNVEIPSPKFLPLFTVCCVQIFMKRVQNLKPPTLILTVLFKVFMKNAWNPKSPRLIFTVLWMKVFLKDVWIPRSPMLSFIVWCIQLFIKDVWKVTYADLCKFLWNMAKTPKSPMFIYTVCCVQVHERCLKPQINNAVLCYVLFQVFMKNVWDPKLPVDYIGLHLFDDTSYRTY